MMGFAAHIEQVVKDSFWQRVQSWDGALMHAEMVTRQISALVQRVKPKNWPGPAWPGHINLLIGGKKILN